MTMTEKKTKPEKLKRLLVTEHDAGVIVPLELRPFTDVLSEASKAAWSMN